MTISVHIDGYLPILTRQAQGSDWWSTVRRAVFGLAVLVIFLAAVPGLLRLGGMQVTAVIGHSMGQAVPDQSIVITRSVSGESLRVGDVFIFDARWLDGGAGAMNVVHRLNVIASTPTGLVGYTSGDANAIADPQVVSLQGEMPVVKLVVPFARVFYEMSSKTVFLVVIGLVFLLLVSTRSSSNTGGLKRAQEMIARRSLAV